MKKYFLLLVYCFTLGFLRAEDGYRLWLRYDKIDDDNLLAQYRNSISSIHFTNSSATLDAAKAELLNGLSGLLVKNITEQELIENGSIVAGPAGDPTIHALIQANIFHKIGKEGFVIETRNYSGKNIIVIAANNNIG
ncbi:MAG TPA: alpha-glucuronidase family glycosyl hydrolase, partial [Parafilimonas sp.]|nr:alpha-glucuronidase family glycosyl hydrolase [Parafilimonas sp.]